MEMSCESVKYEEDSRRPNSCKFVELHVLCVPGEQWNVELNKVPAEATESFISAGFIRAYPDITLKTLRRELDIHLGTSRTINKYSFLKCVGRSLALVKSKQERDLKVKTFAPPYAPQPELYLLPALETDSSFCSQSFTPDTSSSSPDQQIYYQPPKTCSLPTGTKEHVKFPHIPQCSQQPPRNSGHEEEEEEDEDDNEEDEEDNQSGISSEEGNDEEGVCPVRRAEQESCRRKQQKQRALQLVSLGKALEADLASVKPYSQGNFRKNQSHTDQDSRSAESVEDRDSCFSPADGTVKSKDVSMLKSIRNNPASGVSGSSAPQSRLVNCTSPSLGLNLATVINAAAPAPSVFPTSREAAIKEIKLVKEERKQLEWTRQELLRKGKDLLAQNRHRRNRARDSWKKKYFETKKATAPLEDSLKNLRQELDTFYNKLLHQLHARESRGKPKRQGRASLKNELIIQIMTVNYEIDNLKMKVEDARMKLWTEIKLRTQAATELRSLKAELAQKKSQSSHPALMENTGRDGLLNGS